MSRRLESVFFGSGQYPRLARVLEHTARRHSPGWEVRVRRVDPGALRAASGSQSHADNAWKLRCWRDIVAQVDIGAELLLVDVDTFVTGPLDPLWDLEFDVAYTARSEARFPLNAGVLAARVGPGARRFFDAWVELDSAFLRDAEAHRPWRQRYGGMNQASLGALLEGGAAGARVVALPCAVWNCEDTCWERFDPAATRIVHVKSALRMAVFGIASAPRVRKLARLWLELEREVTG